MRKLHWTILGGLVVCACMWGQLTTPLWGQQKTEAGKPEPSQGQLTAAEEENRLIDIRYAEAYLTLMEATLARYEEANRNAPNTVRGTVIQGLQDAVRKARERVEMAKTDDAGDSKIYVTSAEADLRLREELLRRAEAANARSPGAFSAGEVARLKAHVELCKVRVEKARHLAADSPVANVRYELEIMREDLQEVQLYIALLRRN